MTRHGKPSIVREVKNCLRLINRIGHSKREARHQGQRGIHSQKQWEHTLSASQNFVKWCRQEKGVQSLSELSTEHYIAYLNHLEKENRSVGHRRNVETAIRLLNEGIQLYFKQIKKDPPQFVPEKRMTDWRELKKPRNRSYSFEEYEAILKHASTEAGKAIKLMWNLGLRIKEAANIRGHHFSESEGKMMVLIQSGEASGITKGGRFRITPVPDHFKEDLKEILANRKAEETVVAVKYETIRHAVYQACKKAEIEQDGRGCHGFRHAYVRNRLVEELKKAGIFEEAQEMLNRIFENRDQDKLSDYGIFSNEKKNLYYRIKMIMNQIHQEIGHGDDRWDLAEVYMRD